MHEAGDLMLIHSLLLFFLFSYLFFLFWCRSAWGANLEGENVGYYCLVPSSTLQYSVTPWEYLGYVTSVTHSHTNLALYTLH